MDNTDWANRLRYAELRRKEAESAGPAGRIRWKRRGLTVNIPSDRFHEALSRFTIAGERFAMNLSEPLHRKFAHRYLRYLQELAHGEMPPRPNAVCLPAYRLIRYEMDRIFHSCFETPEERIAS